MTKTKFLVCLLLVSAGFLIVASLAYAVAPVLSETTVVPVSTVKASSAAKVIGAFAVTNPNGPGADTIDQFTVENKAALTAVTADIASVAIYSDGSTLGIIDGADAVACAEATTNTTTNFDAGGSVITFTCSSPISIGSGVTQNYLAVITTTVGATNGRTMAAKVNAHLVTAATSGASDLSTTNSITIDTAVPTLSTSTTFPQNLALGVPISSFIHVGFNENVDLSTINSTNVTFCSVAACGNPGAVAAASGLRPFPNGFDIVVSSPPTFAASSRFAKVASTSTAFYNMTGTIVPQPSTGYASPTAGDIVITQRETFPPEIGVITSATLTAGTFAVNGFASFGGQQITKFAAPGADHTGGVGDAAKNLTVGDIIVVNTATNPTSAKYDWHMVTSAVSNAAINAGALRLDSLGSAPTFNTHPGGGASSFSAIAPTATAADDNANTGSGLLAVTQGDMVFVKLVGGSYGWHLVTTTGNMSSSSGEGTAVVDGLTAGISLVVASSQMSRLTPGAQEAVTASTALSFGDIVLAKTTANASNNNSYAFHMVSGADTVANATGALRFDNFPGSLTPSTVYVASVTTGVKDTAGNALAASALTFTTGSTGSTNTTPPFVQSSQPQSGSQNHPISAPIKLTFSVDMSTTGGNSGANSVTNTSNISLFLDSFGTPGAQVPTTNTCDSPCRTVTILPSTVPNNGIAASLTASTSYVVRVATGTQSSTGTSNSQPYFLSFKTPSGAADTAAPTVIGVNPANLATGAALGTVVTAGFSEDMDPATITTSTITLSGGITGTVTYNPQSRSASFAPSTALTANTSYTFTIVSGDSGVKDLSGNPLVANYTSAFTTTATADEVKPFLTFANADDFSVAVTFSEQMKSGGGPNAVDNITNYTLETGAAGAVFATMGLGGKTVTYEAGTKTARITGLSLVN